MKIIITGGEGQLGRELGQIFKEEGHTVLQYSKQQLDITDRTQIREILKKIEPELIINTAAFTKVDRCETELEKAYLINGIGPYYLAVEAKKKNIKLFHISTDYVYSGDKLSPYEEEDTPYPKTIYGKSKRLGEELALMACENITIIRTSWLYGHGGQNFVNTIKKLSNQLGEIRVVNDQYGCPTYTKDLGIVIKELITRPPGIYHVTNSGSCSWFEFAREIIKLLKKQTKIIPVSTEEYGLKTRRPLYSVLSNKKLNSFDIKTRNWKEGLQEYLKKECADKNED
ncbi:dTDP-4-dehydrorhamnose reductase [Priestia megaterium]|uniref:dTDP-4-dehydrorhamnose reductase n=1 Tax=Priestia megaterium TaxID=1404 RepID=UPI00207ACB20|nr:dTDP-4-dehydrorhamnose reductase [Priestia megaterium]USL39508.1 dTDP-4-dehydrorhamnose reductase [Priestia megaterium]